VAEQRCYVVEVMGRRCGYLAMMGGLATGRSALYLHEDGVTLKGLVAISSSSSPDSSWAGGWA